MRKADFPIFNRHDQPAPLVYLDSAATSQKPEAVIEAVSRYYREFNANIHRGAYTLCEDATRRFESTRSALRNFLHAPDEGHIIFTSGTTEGINLVARGWAEKYLQPGDGILITEMEHHSNLVPWHQIARTRGAILHILPVNDDFELELSLLDALLDRNVKLVALCHVSNVLGTVNPVAEIVVRAHAAGAVVLVDGAQAVPHLPVDLAVLGADFYAGSGHKMVGPTGTGFLYGREELLAEMTPLAWGGDMVVQVTTESVTLRDPPYKFEAGTQNLAGIEGLGAAITYLKNAGMEAIAQHTRDLVREAREALSDLPGIRFYSPYEPTPAGILSFTIENVPLADLAATLDAHNVAIRTGGLCAHPLMQRLGVPGAARASFYLYNDRQDIDALHAGLAEALAKAGGRDASSVPPSCNLNPPLSEADVMAAGVTTSPVGSFYRDVYADLKEIWRETTGSSEICIAVLDGMADTSHPSLQGALLDHIDTIGSAGAHRGLALAHGTHVASIIFGQHSSPVPGVAPDCRGLMLPIFREKAGDIVACSQLDLTRTVSQAVDQGVQVINISGGQFESDGKAERYLSRAIDMCAKNGILVVTAAGNNGCHCHHVPGSLPQVLVVGAADDDGNPMAFSNWGDLYLDHGLLAPGHAIPGAVPGGGVEQRDGTSYATPIVTGIVALLLSLQKIRGQPPDPYVIKNALLESATPCNAGDTNGCQRWLRGRLNLNKAHSLLFGERADGSPIICNELSPRPEVSIRPQRPTAGLIKNTYCNPNGGDTMADTTETIQSIPMNDVKTSVPTEAGPTPAGMVQAAGCQAPPPEATPQENVQSNQEPVPGAPPPPLPTGVLSPCIGQYLPSNKPIQKVYALGTIGYDLVDEARRDGIIQNLSNGANPFNEADMLAHFEAHPWDAGAVVWTLNLNATPIYAILPSGPFARAGYILLRDFLKSQVEQGAERVSLPGIIGGKTQLMSGLEVPVVYPDLRGLYCWKTRDLVEKLCGTKGGEGYEEKHEGVRNLLDRFYYDLENLGLAPQDRAINYAATNAFNIERIFEKTHKRDFQLQGISADKSTTCRPGSDCWDVKLSFFDPEKHTRRARQVFRYTVDVSDTIPVSVGNIRSWNEY